MLTSFAKPGAKEKRGAICGGAVACDKSPSSLQHGNGSREKHGAVKHSHGILIWPLRVVTDAGMQIEEPFTVLPPATICG